MRTRLNSRGRTRELWASGNLVRGLEAPIHGPQKQLPAIRLVDGVRPAKGQRRQRTATPILATAPRRRSRFRPAPCPPAAPRARQRTPARDDGSAPRKFSRRHGVPRSPTTGGEVPGEVPGGLGRRLGRNFTGRIGV